MLNIFFNRRQILCVLFTGEADSGTAGSGTARTTNTVNVIFRIVRQVVIEYVGHFINVQTTGGNVSGDQYIKIVPGEVFKEL